MIDSKKQISQSIDQTLRSGVSLVTCCMNRWENLSKVLPAWLKQQQIDEIIIVDWSSDDPVQNHVAAFDDEKGKIKIVRVENEERWILSLAFNLGFRLASFDRIIKADSDIEIHESFFERNLLKTGEFVAGNWRLVPDDQAHVNGFFHAFTKDLARVGGFNEFITTYGWDDDDLYERLMDAGLHRRDVDTRTIYHIPHGDETRLGGLAPSKRAETISAYEDLRRQPLYSSRKNHYLAKSMPAWSASRAMAAFAIVEESKRYSRLTRIAAADNVVPGEVVEQAEFHALREVAAWRLGKYVLGYDRQSLETLLSRPMAELQRPGVYRRLVNLGAGLKSTVTRLAAGQAVSDSLNRRVSINSPKLKLYVDVQHGLGNRLRAMGSAAAVAEATGRELVAIWQPDVHCQCRLSDLFDYDGAVIETGFQPSAVARGMKIYNYMEAEAGSRKGARIEIPPEQDLYVRTAYVLNSALTSWEAENGFLRNLKPVDEVVELVGAARQTYDLSAHVRMEGGREYEHLPYEAPSNWKWSSHRKIARWRKKSHFSNFMRRIDELVSDGKASEIFLAADRPEVYEQFQMRYGDRLVMLERKVFDRSAEQMRYALADAILLGRSPRLLGSTWSSFTELAQRLSDRQPDVEMSGRDF